MSDATRQSNQIPPWHMANLPAPRPLSWRNWTSFIGPGIVMMGIQIGGGEWLLGPEVTAKYGGAMMWIASVAIIFQVFYNLECGRYALYCGEPIFTGFMRTWPDPRFWMSLVLVLNFAALIPGLSTHGAAMIAALWLDRPPGEADRQLVTMLSYVLLGMVTLPVLLGGKVYNTLQAVMTLKVFGVLSFCLVIGILFVSPAHWWNIFSGFLKFGAVPTVVDGHDTTVNVFQHWWQYGTFPAVALTGMAVLGGFAGYAGGGGLSNATYSNFVRDKGWGMGSVVGAIPSAVGGHNIALSHVGKVFPINAETMARWKQWWRYILIDQIYVWAPGCFMGMALPALLSLEFAHYSPLHGPQLKWAQSLITADGIRHDPHFSATVAKLLWTITVIVGLLVMLPSQMSIVDDFSRRWTDMLWSGSRRIRARLSGHQVKRVYYTILTGYVVWSFIFAYCFGRYSSPKWQTLVIANLNNVAIGLTALHLLYINTTLLPRELRPRWYHRLGLIGCGVFYLGLAAIVFYASIATKQS